MSGYFIRPADRPSRPSAPGERSETGGTLWDPVGDGNVETPMMNIWIYVYKYICVYVCRCVRACIYTYTYIYIYIYCIYIYKYRHKHIHKRYMIACLVWDRTHHQNDSWVCLKRGYNSHVRLECWRINKILMELVTGATRINIHHFHTWKRHIEKGHTPILSIFPGQNHPFRFIIQHVLNDKRGLMWV